jgi:hypothetical protein
MMLTVEQISFLVHQSMRSNKRSGVALRCVL